MEGKRRFLWLTCNFPPDAGGAGQYVASLVGSLNPSQHTVLTFPRPDAETFDRQQPYAIVRRELVTARGLLRPGWWTGRAVVRALARTAGVTDVVVNDVLPLGTIAWSLLRHSSIRYHVILHGLDILLALRSARRRWLVRRILTGASSVLANSRFTSEQLMRAGIHAAPVHVVYPSTDFPVFLNKSAVDIRNARERLTRELRIGAGPVVLTVARLVKRKGHDTVLAALPAIRRRHPDVVYVIASDGPHQHTLETIANRLGISECVRFVGRQVNRTEIAALYQLARVFVMVPHAPDGPDVEGFGIVYLEAAAAGLPCVASASGGVAEAVVDGETGFVVPPDTTEAVVEKVHALLADPALATRLGRAGERRVAAQFSGPAIAEQFMAALGSP